MEKFTTQIEEPDALSNSLERSGLTQSESSYLRELEIEKIENQVPFDEISYSRMSPSQLDYLQEVMPIHRPELVINRIDELNGCKPPKAIDADQEVAEIIAPIKEGIDPIYLEAPQDGVQIEEIAERMTQMEGVDFSEWKELSMDERMEILQKMECEIANIAHRPACTILCKSLGKGHFGYYTTGKESITINSDCIRSNAFNDYKETLDTLIHEGRHAYQDYNLNKRQVHPRQGDLSNWKINEQDYGYQDVKHCGFKLYELQPVEADARAFAEDVLKQYQNKIA